MKILRKMQRAIAETHDSVLEAFQNAYQDAIDKHWENFKNGTRDPKQVVRNYEARSTISKVFSWGGGYDRLEYHAAQDFLRN